jgi:tetratricopeptide (TPR) repeat protein
MIVYDAFISYSHARDKKIAAALQSVVQTLGKPWYKRRGLRLFRDDTSLSATPHLWPSIELALSQSPFLIFLASPEAAQSPWVEKEVVYWLANKSAETLLIAVTDGTLVWDAGKGDFLWSNSTPLPACLKGKFAAEPKWVDLRAYRDEVNRSDRRFMELAADFAAAIRGVPKEDLLSEEVRQQRRALTLAWSAVALLIALAGAAVWQWKSALQAERIAVAQKQRAEKDLGAAKGAVNDLIFNIAQGLGYDSSTLPVSTIHHILDTVKTTIESLAATEPGDTDLQRSRLTMLGNFAETYLKAGDLEDAQKTAEQSLALARALARDKGDAEAASDLSVSYHKVGDVLQAKGDLDGALTAYRASLAIAERLAQVDPGNPDWQRDLSVATNKIGDVLVAQGHLAEALASYQRSLAIREALAKADPANAEAQRNLSLSYERIGDVLVAQGDLAGALKSFQAGATIAERLAKADAGNPDLQRDLSIADEKLGDTDLAQGHISDALGAYQASHAIRERLAKSDTGNSDWQNNLALSDERMGDVLLLQGDGAGAFKAYQAALTIAKGLADSDPGNADWLRELSVATNKVGDAELAQNQLPEALASYQTSTAIRERLAKADPGNADWQRDLAVSYARLAAVYEKTGDRTKALDALRQGEVLIAALTKLAPDSAQWQKDLAWFDQQIAALSKQ